MHLENLSFDAVITDKDGLSVEADCCISTPIASGCPASISIEIPHNRERPLRLRNPCTLRSSGCSIEIEIKDLWYRSIEFKLPERKHARATFSINHAGYLHINQKQQNSEFPSLRLLLSPIRFFREHIDSTTVNYLTTPRMSVDLFKLKTADFGDIRFIKFWSIHHVAKNSVSAEVRASFAAEIDYDETTMPPIKELVEKIKSTLIPLAILTRQAITLHGWIWEKSDATEAVWFAPLEPNLAPDMADEPVKDACFTDEFDQHAQALITNFLKAPHDKQEAITLISVALAPHVMRSTAGNFSALFSALEQVIATEKLTKEEREKLRETDAEVIKALYELKHRVETTPGSNAAIVAKRIDGLANSIRGSGPSFNARFEKLQAAYPALNIYMSDLWPLKGNKNQPGLKQIRDSLAHGLRHKYNMEAISVAHWHFARLTERLAFIILGIDVPSGLQLNSCLLSRDRWYKRSVWEDIRAEATQIG